MSTHSGMNDHDTGGGGSGSGNIHIIIGSSSNGSTADPTATPGGGGAKKDNKDTPAKVKGAPSGLSRDQIMTHIFQMLDTDGSGVLEDSEWNRLLSALDGDEDGAIGELSSSSSLKNGGDGNGLDHLRGTSRPITYDEVVSTVRHFSDEKLDDLMWFVESVVRVEHEIRTQRGKGLREWRQIVELMLAEGIAQFCLATQPPTVAKWISNRLRQESWLPGGTAAVGSLDAATTPGGAAITLSEAEVLYLFEIEAPHDMQASIQILIPFYETSTVMKRLVHPNYMNMNAEDNNKRLLQSLERLIRNLDNTKVSTELARSIACIVIAKDGFDLFLRIIRTTVNLESEIKDRITSVIEKLLTFNFEYSVDPVERDVRARVITFLELRAKAKSSRTSKIAVPGHDSDRATITTWVRTIITDPDTAYRAKAVRRLLLWAQANDGVSESEYLRAQASAQPHHHQFDAKGGNSNSNSNSNSNQYNNGNHNAGDGADGLAGMEEGMRRRRPSALLTEGVLQTLLDRLKLNSYYGRHEVVPSIRADIVAIVLSALLKGGEKGKGLFRKLEGIQAFRLILKGRHSMRRHMLPPGGEMDEFDLDPPFSFLNQLDRAYREDFVEPDASGDGARGGGAASSSGAGDHDGSEAHSDDETALGSSNSGEDHHHHHRNHHHHNQHMRHLAGASTASGGDGLMRDDVAAVIYALETLMDESVWGEAGLGNEMLHCVDIFETLINVDPIPHELLRCCLTHQVSSEYITELIKQEGENATIHWCGLVEPMASHMGAAFVPTMGPTETLEDIRQEWLIPLGRNSVLQLFGYARHRLDAGTAAEGIDETEVTQRKLACVLLAKLLPLDSSQIVQVITYMHHVLSHFLVLCSVRRARRAFLEVVERSRGSGADFGSGGGGWNYGSAADYDVFGNTSTTFQTPAFYLSSLVSPFLSGASIGAATDNEDQQGEVLRFRVVCSWRLLQLVAMRWPLSQFVHALMDRAERVVSYTDANRVQREDGAASSACFYSTVEDGKPMWMISARLSSFPFLPSHRIQFPNHTLSTLTRSLAEVLRLISLLCPSEDDAKHGAPTPKEIDARRANASKVSQIVAYALFELCHFSGDVFDFEFVSHVFEDRLGATAEHFQAMHRITEEEASRITPIEIPHDVGVQVFYIADETRSLPELYFLKVVDANWQLWAGNLDRDFPLTALPRDHNWTAFLRGINKN